MIISTCTEHLTDPRKQKNQRYSLNSLVLIIFSSVISGYDSAEEISEFAKLKIDWLRKFVDLESTPCAETIRFLLCAIAPNELIKCFEIFIQENNIDSEGDIISIDGKTMRGTRTKNNGALHIVSAWSNKHGITLSMLESKGKKNEIKTIPDLLDIVDIKKAIVTTDAMGCQKRIASKIVGKKGDYVLQLKGNQGSLFEEIKAYHHRLQRTNYDDIDVDVYEEVDKGHGRLEIRKYTHLPITNWVSGSDGWVNLNSFVMVERTRESNKGIQKETSWYISSLDINAKRVAHAIRSHWGVENPLHWRLDVVFDEDGCALHSGSGPLNMGIIKRFCMNLLSKDTTIKRMKHRVMAASVDDSFREKVLFG